MVNSTDPSCSDVKSGAATVGAIARTVATGVSVAATGRKAIGVSEGEIVDVATGVLEGAMVGIGTGVSVAAAVGAIAAIAGVDVAAITPTWLTAITVGVGVLKRPSD